MYEALSSYTAGTHDAGIAARVSKVRIDKNGRHVGRHDDAQQKQVLSY